MHLPRALRQSLLSKRKAEEAALNEESDRMMEELRDSVKTEREQQQHKFRSHISAAVVKGVKTQ